MKPQFDLIPMVSIHPDGLNVYQKVEWSPYRPKKPKVDHLIKHDKSHNGKVSVAARRKVSKAVQYLLFMANDKELPDSAHGRCYKFKISFITLTLSSAQIHSDSQIKEELLNHLLVELRKYYNVKNYIWRAEKQQNGNIHFHILCDKFIPWSELRDRWNRIQNKLGYVNRYRDQMRSFHQKGFQVRDALLKHWPLEKQVQAYKSGKATDWNSPNSTDIHSVVKTYRIKAYILKYLTKNEENKNILGRMWGCNMELSQIRGGQVVVDSEIEKEIGIIVDSYPESLYESDHFSSIDIPLHALLELNCTALFRVFSQFMMDHFDFNIQTILSG